MFIFRFLRDLNAKAPLLPNSEQNHSHVLFPLHYEESSYKPGITLEYVSVYSTKNIYAAFQTIVNIYLIWKKCTKTYNLRESPYAHEKKSHS